MRFYLFSILLILFYSCKDKNQLNIVVTPATIFLSYKPGQVQNFQISASSTHYSLKKFSIYIYPVYTVRTEIFDSTLTGQNFNWTYSYKAPKCSTQTVFDCEFVINDANGDQIELLYSITDIPDTVALTETSGNVMWSLQSLKQNGYNLHEGRPVFSSDTSADIMDSTFTSVLSRRWITKKNANFVRDNGFDYPNATNISVQNAFNSGQQTNRLTNISNGDIILYHSPDNFYSVIMITNVVDADSTLNDAYDFNFKK